ncbi:MAG: GxxExxY protein [Phycisphaerales bacterium]|jgi:GxxExxY protein
MNDRNQSTPEELNALSESVIGVAIEVHRELGPGLAEKVYEEAMCHELQLRSLKYDRQVPLNVRYKGVSVGDHRLDLVVEGSLVVELKAAERVADIHLVQLVSYLRAGKYPLGLLMNFGRTLMKDGIFRRINSSCLPSSKPLPDSAPLR